MSMVENLAMAELLLVVFLISAGFGLGSLGTLNTVQETRGGTVYNLTCPQPRIEVERSVERTRDELRSVSEVKNHIQNPETKVSYSREGEGVEVDVDAISRPEGMSMRPTIFGGNTVLLEEYDGADIEPGQIIRYESESGGHVIHRVRANYLGTQGYLVVEGDNTASSEKVRRAQITHVVEGVLYT